MILEFRICNIAFWLCISSQKKGCYFSNCAVWKLVTDSSQSVKGPATTCSGRPVAVICSSTVTGWPLQAVAGWASSNCVSAYVPSSCGAVYAGTQLHSYWTPIAGGGPPLDTGHNTSLCASG
jgi:hypothetical protein